MDNTVAAVFQFGLAHQILQHGDVLNLTHTDDDRSHGGGAVHLHLADGIGHIVLLLPVLGSSPLVCALSREVIVIPAIVINRVEQVLQIVEHHAIHGILPFRLLFPVFLPDCRATRQIHTKS